MDETGRVESKKKRAKLRPGNRTDLSTIKAIRERKNRVNIINREPAVRRPRKGRGRLGA